jgi:NAD(P)-dependent dehydrogenase (short-subunit alcohol dehydrogenase family)
MSGGARRVMFVTGGSRGIGAAIVEGAAQQGFDVAFTYHECRDAAERLCDRVGATSSSIRCRAYQLDVRDAAAVERVGDCVLDDFGDVHVVVANAGVAHASLAFWTSDDTWRRVIDTNLTGAFFVARQFLPTLLANGFGRFIFISSVAARGMSGDAAYCASKAGLHGLSAALAKEYGRKGITSNVLLLGLFETGLTSTQLAPEKREFFMTHSPVGRVGRPAEVSAAVNYLASDAAAFVNGQELGVTGGLDWFH